MRLVVFIGAACSSAHAPSVVPAPRVRAPPPPCELGLESLEGRTFVALESVGGDVRINPVARVRFLAGTPLRAQYSAASLSDVWDLECHPYDGRAPFALRCAEAPRLVDWCAALLVSDRPCTPEVLRDLGALGLDETLQSAIAEARAVHDSHRGTEHERRFALVNNNLGNKLQQRLYVGVDTQRCRILVSDTYWTVFNGIPVEDANPVGMNPFVPVEEALGFDHCNVDLLLGMDQPTLPVDSSSLSTHVQRFIGSQPYWFHYLGDRNLDADEGCQYSVDLWSGYRPVALDLEVPVIDGTVQWTVQHRFAKQETVHLWGDVQRPLVVLTINRFRQCGEAPRKKLDTLCEAGFYEEAPGR